MKLNNKNDALLANHN